MRTILIFRTRFVHVYEDILVHAEDPHSRTSTSAPTDNGSKKCHDMVWVQHIKIVLNPTFMISQEGI